MGFDDFEIADFYTCPLITKRGNCDVVLKNCNVARNNTAKRDDGFHYGTCGVYMSEVQRISACPDREIVVEDKKCKTCGYENKVKTEHCKKSRNDCDSCGINTK